VRSISWKATTPPGRSQSRPGPQHHRRGQDGRQPGPARVLESKDHAEEEHGRGLLDGHIRGCVRDEIKAGGGEAKVDELLEVMDRVLRR
jgi:hypothetical protein